jgi:DNA-binding HxlR family transcriptional regulator
VPFCFPSRPKKNNNKKHQGNYLNRNIAIDMGITMTEIFTDKQNKLASMMKALAHPARIAIIQHLVKAQACICGDLVDELGLAQATISQHLKELKTAKLIQGTIDAFFVAYDNKKGCG